MRSGSVTADELFDIRARTKGLTHASFAGGVAFRTLANGGEAIRLQGLQVSPGFFETLRASAQIGRTFDPSGRMDRAAIVLSHAAWQRYFNGNRALLGQEIALFDSLSPNSVIHIAGYMVIGVMPARFAFPDLQAEFWIPAEPGPFNGGTLIARLADGASLDAATTEIGSLLRSLRTHQPGASYRLARMRDTIAAPLRPALLVLSASVVLVLLIACVNVANLLMARASARRGEMADAHRARRGRRASAAPTADGRRRALAPRRPRRRGCGDRRHAAAAHPRLHVRPHRSRRAAAVPAARRDWRRRHRPRLHGSRLGHGRRARRPGPGHRPFRRGSRTGREGLQDDRPGLRIWRGGTSSGFGFGRGQRSRGLLIVVQTALAVVLLTGGGLVIHSYTKLASAELGFQPANVLTFQVSIGDIRGTRLQQIADEIVVRARTIPDVQSAAYARQLPLVVIKEAAWFRHTATPPSPLPRPPRDAPDARLVSQHYFDVLGTRIVAGRGFTDGDRAGAPRVLVINQALATREFPGQNPIGRFVYAGRDSSPWEIVGVAANIRQFGLDQDPQPQFFADMRQWPSDDPVFFTSLGPYYGVRTTGDPAAVVSQLREAARQVRADAGLYNVATMEQLVSNSIVRPRLYATLLGAFAAVAVLLAAIGLYSVMAFAVTQRTREIGVRMALGAPRRAVMTLVIGQGAALVGLGLVLGLGASAAATRVLEGMLFGITPADPATFVAVSALFLLIALAAAYAPARRATRIDPVVALKTE